MRNLFRRKKRASEGTIQSSKTSKENEEVQRFISDFIGVLLLFLKAFSLNAKELNTKEFRSVIAALAQKIKTGKKIKEVGSFFEKNKKMMHLFIKEQNLYLAARETEFKEMIDFLTRAMARVSVDNDDFSEKMLAQTSRIEQATTLSDIKEMKSALKRVIEEVREKVREKQSRDDKQRAMLAEKVKALSNELEKAEKGTLRDSLTGIYNMDAFERYIRKVVERNTVDRTSFAMVALDIDEFDKIKETYGRKLGDRVVLAIAEKCREFLRTGDFSARYQAGLFVMVLPGESLKKAVKRSKQFCKTIAKSKYTLDDMRSEHVLSFTVSMGVSRFKNGDTAGTVTRRTLEALESARNAGGNRVVSDKG